MKTYRYTINSVIDFGKFNGSSIKEMLNDKEACKWLNWLINENAEFRIEGLEHYLDEMAEKRANSTDTVTTEDGKIRVSMDLLNVLYHGYMNKETLEANEKKIKELG